VCLNKNQSRYNITSFLLPHTLSDTYIGECLNKNQSRYNITRFLLPQTLSDTYMENV